MTQHNRDQKISQEGIMLPKTDEQGRIYREVRCPNCRAFICDEYIRVGRIRFKCFRCGRIMIMEFRPHRSKRPAPSEQTKNERTAS